MSYPRICAACLAVIVLAGVFVGPGFAQTPDVAAPALRGTVSAAKPLAKKTAPRKTKPALGATAAAKATEKPELAPWAAIDPARAGEKEQQIPNAAPMPGVHHDVTSAESNTSLGVKFSTNNDPNYGPMNTSGLMNNSNVTGGANAGTSIEPGVKFKF